ncbi:MAG: hypothetical protein E6G89_04800 [Alphaproteobacteria bacterium]|nr:MAG: hypothetical protein E6G89_04800 [Alphaproteobacteria bacterium]
MLDRQGFVKIKNSPRATQIEWSVFAPNWASLYFTMEWLHTFPGPYTLRYYLSGWFEEKYNDVNAARNRIDIIIGKSDVRRRSTMVRSIQNSASTVSSMKHRASSASSASARNPRSPACGA